MLHIIFWIGEIIIIVGSFAIAGLTLKLWEPLNDALNPNFMGILILVGIEAVLNVTLVAVTISYLWIKLLKYKL